MIVPWTSWTTRKTKEKAKCFETTIWTLLQNVEVEGVHSTLTTQLGAKVKTGSHLTFRYLESFLKAFHLGFDAEVQE